MPTPTGTPRKTGKLTVKVKHPKKLRRGARLSVPTKFAGYKRATYQWLRNGKEIRRATKRTYTLTRKDRGKQVACRVSLRPTASGRRVVVTTKALKVPRKR